MYLPLVLPLKKNCCVIEGLLEDPKVVVSLIKLHPLEKLWALSLTEAFSVSSEFHTNNVFQPLRPQTGNDKTTTTTSLNLSQYLLYTAPLKEFGDTYTLSTLQLNSHIFFEANPTLHPGYLPKLPTASTKDTTNTISQEGYLLHEDDS